MTELGETGAVLLPHPPQVPTFRSITVLRERAALISCNRQVKRRHSEEKP